MIRDFGKPMYAKNFGYDVTVRPASVRTYVRPPFYVSHREMSHSTCRATRVFSAGNGMAYFFVSRKGDQIQRQCSLFSVANTAIKGDFETIALAPNKGLLIQEGNSNSLLLQ